MPTPNVSLPGFAEAIAAGCLCPVNPGWKIGEQSTVPVRCDCPLHGRPAWQAAAATADNGCRCRSVMSYTGDCPLHRMG